MKRWLTLAACAALAAGCSDTTQPLSPDLAPGAPQALLLNPTVRIDPVLSGLLALASPTQRLEVLVTHDSLASSESVAGSILGTGAGVIRFKHLPVVAALATPAQITQITGVAGVRGVYANKQLTYYLAESVRGIRADAVHAMNVTGKGVGIAILDSGVDGLHSSDVRYPERTVQNVKFAGSMADLVTFDPTEPAVGFELFVENLPTSETSSGHGTHVAGIAASDGSQSGGRYRGVAPGANVIGIGAGDALFVFWILAGFDYLIENQEKYNIQVVNNSWGTTGDFVADDPINLATREAYKKGIAVVFAAGNEGPGENTLNPYSAAPWVISVAAGCKTVSPDPTNSATYCAGGYSQLADFSSRGRRGDALYHPDITAPGVNIVSTRSPFGVVVGATAIPSDALDCAIAQESLLYQMCISGTSMAAPHVAGVIALMEEAARGRLTPDQAYSAITRNARPMLGYGQWEVGSGYLDAYAAVRAVKR